jgi:signal-transduction protein with cAMP-binding, CBS, and nucleotidyltransferase domain
MQIVGAARVHALERGLGETNTIDRFRAYAPATLSSAETREITDAMQHLMRLRLGHQLDQHIRSEPTDNFVVPAQLARGDRLLLREALRTVRRLQTTLRQQFATDVIPR